MRLLVRPTEVFVSKFVIFHSAHTHRHTHTHTHIIHPGPKDLWASSSNPDSDVNADNRIANPAHASKPAPRASNPAPGASNPVSSLNSSFVHTTRKHTYTYTHIHTFTQSHVVHHLYTHTQHTHRIMHTHKTKLTRASPRASNRGLRL